jgi:hypothetical protein
MIRNISFQNEELAISCADKILKDFGIQSGEYIGDESVDGFYIEFDKDENIDEKKLEEVIFSFGGKVEILYVKRKKSKQVSEEDDDDLDGDSEEEWNEEEEEGLSYMERIRLKALPEKIENIINNFHKRTKDDTEASKKEWFKNTFKMLQEMGEIGFIESASLTMDLHIIYFLIYNRRFEKRKHNGYGM